MWSLCLIERQSSLKLKYDWIWYNFWTNGTKVPKRSQKCGSHRLTDSHIHNWFLNYIQSDSTVTNFGVSTLKQRVATHKNSDWSSLLALPFPLSMLIKTVLMVQTDTVDWQHVSARNFYRTKGYQVFLLANRKWRNPSYSGHIK